MNCFVFSYLSAFQRTQIVLKPLSGLVKLGLLGLPAKTPGRDITIIIIIIMRGVFLSGAPWYSLLISFVVAPVFQGTYHGLSFILSFSFSLSGLFYSWFFSAGASKTQNLSFQQVFITKIKRVRKGKEWAETYNNLTSRILKNQEIYYCSTANPGLPRSGSYNTRSYSAIYTQYYCWPRRSRSSSTLH